MNSSYRLTAEMAADRGIRRLQRYIERTTVEEKAERYLTGKRRRPRKQNPVASVSPLSHYGLGDPAFLPFSFPHFLQLFEYASMQRMVESKLSASIISKLETLDDVLPVDII